MLNGGDRSDVRNYAVENYTLLMFKFHISTLEHFQITNLLSGRVMVFNATFNNISAISWRLVLLLEQTGLPGENKRTVASY